MHSRTRPSHRGDTRLTNFQMNLDIHSRATAANLIMIRVILVVMVVVMADTKVMMIIRRAKVVD